MKRYAESLKRIPTRSCYHPPGLVSLLRRGEDMRRYRTRPTDDTVIAGNPSGEWVLWKDVQAMIKNAQEVARLLELGDQRLLAGDGPCGEQNAAVALSPEESMKLYQACKKIAAEAVGS